MTTPELRELDAFLAEHAMGYMWLDFSYSANKYLVPGAFAEHFANITDHSECLAGSHISCRKSQGPLQHVPAYSTDPAASDALLDRMAELGFRICIMLFPGMDARVTIFDSHDDDTEERGSGIDSRDPNKHIAIACGCRAALEGRIAAKAALESEKV